MNTLEERFSGALHNTSRAWKAAVDRRLKYLGLSQASWTTIAAIAKADESMSQIELANRLGVEAATMVSMIDRLVKANLITRRTVKQRSTHQVDRVDRSRNPALWQGQGGGDDFP